MAAKSWQIARQPDVWHSAVRFAVTLSVVDVTVWLLFTDATAVVLGSFAVICMLYFLDYPGSTRERIVGYGSAAIVGAFAVVLGSVLSGWLALAVAGAFVVSFIFSYVRVLRGFAARASVGLQGAFFLPLMSSASPTQIPELVGSWLIGASMATVAGVLIFPDRTGNRIRDLVAAWLQDAATICDPDSRAEEARAARERARLTRERIRLTVQADNVRLGAVGRRQRALAAMVDGTQWGTAALDVIDRSRADEHDGGKHSHALLAASAEAFSCAASALTSQRPPSRVPDLPAARGDDLHDLGGESPGQLREHYPARLVSILAMRMLWLAGVSRGCAYPEPDIGSVADRRPLALLQVNVTRGSLWFTSALRTGAAIALCVLLVRLIGLDHGLWVVLAALCVTQVSFSTTSGGTTAMRMAVGAIVGICVASLATLAPLPYPAFVVLLPVLALLASIASHAGAFLAQASYTPFALTNLAVLEWTTDRDLEYLRIEDITLGVVVAGVLTLLTFPYGLRRQIGQQAKQATESSAAYLRSAMAMAGGRATDAVGLREEAIRGVSVLESTLQAASQRPTLPLDELLASFRADAGARDRIVGGDACHQLALDQREDPRLEPVARVFVDWWANSPLNTEVPGAEHVRAPGQD